MKKLINIMSCTLVLFFLAQAVSAIPDVEIYNFRASGTHHFYFDEHLPEYQPNLTINQLAEVYTYFNESQFYYIVIRRADADVSPYDDFYISFACDGEPTTAFQTTDYTSWVESGQVSFKKQLTQSQFKQVGNATLLTSYGSCVIYSANSLVVDGNSGYTQFKVDLVPVTTTAVQTIESYCEEVALSDTITAELTAIDTIFTTNVNFVSTLFTVFQILAIVLVVLGIPIMIFLLIRWVIYKITGYRILERRPEQI